MTVTISDATDTPTSEALSEQDSEIRSSTAQFEEWVFGFLDAVFTLVIDHDTSEIQPAP